MKLRIQKYYILIFVLFLGLSFTVGPELYAKKKKSQKTSKNDKKKKSSRKSSPRHVKVSIHKLTDDDEEGVDEEKDDKDELSRTTTLRIRDLNNEEEEDDSLEEEEEERKGVIDDEEVVVKDKNGNEDIIEVPEGLITDSDNGDSLDWMGRRYLEEDTTSMLQGLNPMFADSIYLDRLKRLPTAIEMPWNPVVQKFIDRYTGRLRRSVSYMLGAQNFYMPIFEQALEVYDIPQELKYLPVIESALKPVATSRVGAAGLWQFMVGTGKRYGLKVNSLIDERRDPVKASYAAAHYLSDLYQIFGDWSLVIAAYNCGPGNIQKAIQRSGGRHDFWEIYPWLPSETRGYVPAFIAANYIMNYYCEHNIVPMTATLPEETDTILLYQNLHLKQVSEILDIPMEELRALNPQYRRDIVTGYSEPTDLRLPKEYISKYIEHENEILDYDVSDLMKRDVVDVNEAQMGYRHAYHKRNYRSKYNRLLEKRSKRKSKKKRHRR